MPDEEWSSPIDRHKQHEYGFKIVNIAEQWWRGLDKIEPRLRDLLERTIVIRDTGDEEHDKKVTRHELFHDIYGLAIVPEQPVRYKNEMEKRLFAQIKNEILSYLTEDVRRYNLTSLSREARRLDPHGDKFVSGNFMDLWGLVVRSLQEELNKNCPAVLKQNVMLI